VLRLQPRRLGEAVAGADVVAAEAPPLVQM
jgi:hypothetical protein